MKKNVFYLFIGLFLVAGFAGCTSDGNDGPGVIPPEGEESVVEIKVLTDRQSSQRAAGDDTEPATDEEKTISGDVEILVYDSNTHALEHRETVQIINGGKATFRIKSGKKFFHVIANQAVGASAPAVVIHNDRPAFEKQVMTATFGPTNDVPNTTSPVFYLGTLWGEEKQVAPGGTASDPVKITVNIGRVATGKIKLHKVAKGNNSKMKGSFTLPFYRMASIPKTYYQIGQYEGTVAPPTDGHGAVISAVHEEEWGYVDNSGSDPVYIQNDAFHNYENWKEVTALPVNDDPLDNFFYTIENTTALDQQGDQYYGNSTHVQMRTVYTPTAEEISNVDDLLPKGSFDGPTFYTAYLISDGKRLLFDKNPGLAANNPNPDIDPETIKVYENGYNYHNFPVRDKNESDPVKMNCVLRNHYYELEVRSIYDLGDPSDKVKPEIPLVSETDVEVTVRVIDWSQVTQVEDL